MYTYICTDVTIHIEKEINTYIYTYVYTLHKRTPDRYRLKTQARDKPVMHAPHLPLSGELPSVSEHKITENPHWIKRP